MLPANLRCAALQRTGDEWLNIRRESELEMHLEVYASDSSNVDRIAGRATLLRNMYQDLVSLRIDATRLTDWDAALWTRSRVKGGTKTAGALARTTLQLAGMSHWACSAEWTLTAELAARSAGASTVVSTRRSEAHRVRPHSVTSVCGVYSCSSLLDPAPNAKFGPIGDAVMCTACFGRT